MKKKTVQKELRFWIIAIALFGILYFTGYHTFVIGKIQSVLLYTNLITPNTDTSNLDKGYDQFNYKGVLQSSTNEIIPLPSLEGKILFINFWASWCPPCIAELPTINQLKSELGNNDEIVFLLVNVDEQKQKADMILDRSGVEIEYFRTIQGLNLPYQVLPTTYIVDKSGNIVVKQEGMANFNTDKFKNFLTDL